MRKEEEEPERRKRSRKRIRGSLFFDILLFPLTLLKERKVKRRRIKSKEEAEKEEEKEREKEEWEINAQQERLCNRILKNKKGIPISRTTQAAFLIFLPLLILPFLQQKEIDSTAATTKSSSDYSDYKVIFLPPDSPSAIYSNAPPAEYFEYAGKASKSTGVRKSLLLGLIDVESGFGKNVGKVGAWKKAYRHKACFRQKQAFRKIVKGLKLNPDTVPVSQKQWYGKCGGAMGPAQIMPATWLQYRNQVVRTTGRFPPNPWNPEDSIIASALILRDNGAAEGREKEAILRYFAGRNWKNPKHYFFYWKVKKSADRYES